MEAKRKIEFSNLFTLLKSTGTGMVGLIFTLAAIALAVFSVILSNDSSGSHGKYNYALIEKNGVENIAKIISVDTIEDVTVGGEHPRNVNYVYIDNNKEVIDAFETIDIIKISGYKRGQKISLLTYQGQSMIKGLKPFSFPFYFFYVMAIVCAIIGIPLLLKGLKPALKQFHLHKHGIIKDGVIVSVNPNKKPLKFVKTNIKPSVTVHYYFLDNNENRVFGKTRSKDVAFLNGLKEGDSIKLFVSEKDGITSCIVPRVEAQKYNWVV